MKTKSKIIISALLIVILLCASLSLRLLVLSMNRTIEENGKISMQAVVEQIQQTYEMQIENYYSRLRIVEVYAVQGGDELLDNADTIWLLNKLQEETGSQIFFIKDNGAAIDINKSKCKLDISSALLMDLKNSQNIAKLVSYKEGEQNKGGFLLAIPSREYYIDGERYTAIGALVDRSKIDAVLKLYVYGGEAFLFMLDTEGEIVYTNQKDEKLFQNYSLLKHMRIDDALTEEEESTLNKAFTAQGNGTELLGGENAYYLGYCPIVNNNSMLVCIVPKRIVDNTLMTYQHTVLLSTMVMAGIIILLFAGLFYTVTRLSLADRKAEYEQEKQRRQYQNMKELEALNKNLEAAQTVTAEALQVAETANKAKTDFLSNMSHDIRTPMNAIIGIASLIEHDAGDEAKVREYVRKIEVSSQNLLGIINDVLDMSKIESGKTTLNYADFSISELIGELDVLFRPQAEEKHQSFEIIRENIRHEWLNGDSIRIIQILSNLLSNAVKYTQEGGHIHFIIEEIKTKSQVYAKYRFIVKDDGVGIEEDFKDKIFDAFTREESSLTNKIQGTGLGMAITRNLVELMGGSIEVESEKGKGSTFELMLDLKLAEERSVQQELKEQDDEQNINVLNGMHFLCAEDNSLNAEILTELLRMQGADCIICENGAKAVEVFEQSSPGAIDMILMDVQMPVMNGYEATRAIRTCGHESAKTIPIIAMTANAFSEDIQTSLISGMNAHVSKPVDMEVLKRTIRSIKSGRGAITIASETDSRDRR